MRCALHIGDIYSDIAVLRDDGAFAYRKQFDIPQTYSALISSLSDIIQDIISEFDITADIGICIKGRYESQTKHMVTTDTHVIAGQPLKHHLQAALNRNVKIYGYGQALAQSALITESSPADKTIFALILDEEIHGGLVANGRLIKGRHGEAANWGHIALPWPTSQEWEGRQCICGRSDCLATFVTLSALSYDYEMLTRTKLEALQIIEQAQRGDIIAESVMQIYEDRLARGLAMVINLIDPDIIILGGQLADTQRLYTHIPRKWPGYVSIKPLHTSLIAVQNIIPGGLEDAFLLGTY